VKRLIVTTLLATSLSHAAYAEAPKAITAQPELERVGDQFMGALKGGKAAEAFTEAFKDMPSMNTSSQTAGATIAALLNGFGGVEDWSPLAEKVYSGTFVRRSYYVRTPHAPLFVTIIFYNPGAKWTISDVQIGTYYNEKNTNHLVEP
jgi:hypothetical protein